MSHLACADEPANPDERGPARAVRRLRAKLPPAPASLVELGRNVPRARLPLRSGAAGHRALRRPRVRRCEPTRCSRSSACRRASCRCGTSAPGETVGYGATFMVARPSRIATIACGYADGFLRALSGPSGHPGPVGYIGDASGAGRRPRVDGPHHRRRHRRAAGACRARRLGRGDGRPRHASTTSPIAPAPSATSCCRACRSACTASTKACSTQRDAADMAKPAKSSFVCQNCGAVSSRWAGKCVAAANGTPSSRRRTSRRVAGLRPDARRQGPRGRARNARRAQRGGAAHRRPALPNSTASPAAASCPGSALLIGGEPGIGKSTLLLQVAATFANAGRRAVYFSGEEAAAQVRLRAERLGLAEVAGRARRRDQSRQHPRDARATAGAPISSIINSIQTLWADGLDAAPGTVSPGPRGDAVADPLRQAVRQRAAARRPRHQGRPDRRPQGDRAHGRHRALFRGRPRPSLPHPARGQEPLRRHRRDRRLRDGRPTACARSPTHPNCSSAIATTARRARPCSPASRAPGRCWSRSRRWWRRRRSARRAARPSAGIPTACRCCSPCSTRAAG